MGEMTINVGHKAYGYRPLDEYKNILIEYGVPQKKLKIDLDKIAHYYKKAAKYLIVLEVAFLALGVTTVFASPEAVPVGIDLGPIDKFSKEIWLTMLKALSYISIPIFAWIGYIFAFAGTNSGKRTAAKITLFSLVGGIAFVAGAPWAGHELVGLCRRIFHV
jgi:hypothetical protein